MDWIIWWLIGCVIIGVAFYFIEEGQKKNNCVTSCKKYNFHPTHTYGNFLVDIISSRWMVSYPTGTSKVYHIADTTYWEISEDRTGYKTDGAITRTAVGGALFGALGAFAGATTAKKIPTIRSVNVDICVCDPDTPLVVVPCLNAQSGEKVRTDSIRYSLAKDNAKEIVAVLNAMNNRYMNSTYDNEEDCML